MAATAQRQFSFRVDHVSQGSKNNFDKTDSLKVRFPINCKLVKEILCFLRHTGGDDTSSQ